jgi:hypothetical protein
MTMDLKALAAILDAGREAAESMQDAPLAAVLTRMAETAVVWAEEPDAREWWYTTVRDRYTRR